MREREREREGSFQNPLEPLVAKLAAEYTDAASLSARLAALFQVRARGEGAGEGGCAGSAGAGSFHLAPSVHRLAITTPPPPPLPIFPTNTRATRTCARTHAHTGLGLGRIGRPVEPGVLRGREEAGAGAMGDLP